MKKLSGTLRITVTPPESGGRGYFAIVFVPHVGRLSTPVVKAHTHEELASFLIELRMDEEDAVRWAGKARAEGVVLIAPFERSDLQLKESGLLA